VLSCELQQGLAKSWALGVHRSEIARRSLSLIGQYTLQTAQYASMLLPAFKRKTTVWREYACWILSFRHIGQVATNLIGALRTSGLLAARVLALPAGGSPFLSVTRFLLERSSPPDYWDVAAGCVPDCQSRARGTAALQQWRRGGNGTDAAWRSLIGFAAIRYVGFDLRNMGLAGRAVSRI